MSDFRASSTHDRIIARDVHIDAQMATATRVTTAAPPQSEVASHWRVDTAYRVVQFAVKHLGLTAARGRFTDVQGVIHFRTEGAS